MDPRETDASLVDLELSLYTLVSDFRKDRLGRKLGHGKPVNLPPVSDPTDPDPPTDPPAPPGVALVVVTPSPVTIVSTGSQQLTAVAKDANGTTLSGKTFSYASSATGVATVSSGGLVTAVTSGTTVVTVTCEGVPTTVAVTVTAVPVASITLSPSSFSKTVGATQQLTATVKDAGNNTLTGRSVVWSSVGAATASVSQSGLVTAVAAGTTTIRAISEGITGTSAATVTAPAPAAVASVVVTPSSFLVAEAGTVQLAAVAKDAGGATLTGRTITWASGDITKATVNASTGLVTGVAAGSVTITATCETIPGTSAATVVAGGVVTTTIAASITRLSGSTGTATAQLVCPLQPGQLQPGQLSQFAVWVNEGSGLVEKAAYVSAAEGRHSDGSVRVVHAQCAVASLAVGASFAAEYRIGIARSSSISAVALTTLGSFDAATVSTASGSPVFSGGHPTVTQPTNSPVHQFHTLGFPRVVGLPTSATHLIACDLLEPMLTRSAEIALASKYAAVVNDFETSSATQWGWFDNLTHLGASVGDHLYDIYYYDRAKTHFAHWIRSGTVEYYRRACAYAYNWREGYGRRALGYQWTQGYAADPYSLFPEGVALHYWLTGDTASRDAVYHMTAWWLTSTAWDTELASANNRYQDPRQQARTLDGWTYAHRLGFATVTRDATTVTPATKALDILSKILGGQSVPTYQASGTYAGVWMQPFASSCPTTLTVFMVGICCTALIRYWTWVDQDARIPVAVKAACDWLWANAWRGDTEKCFKYLSNEACPAEGGTRAAADLNPLLLIPFTWYFRQSGDTVYRDRADLVFAGTTPTVWGDPEPGGNELEGQKQFNQGACESYRHSKLRNG